MTGNDCFIFYVDAANQINDQTVVLGADVDAIEPVCKIARAKGLDAFEITEFDITMAIDVSKFQLFYNLRGNIYAKRNLRRYRDDLLFLRKTR